MAGGPLQGSREGGHFLTAGWRSASEGAGPGTGGKMRLSVPPLEPTLTIAPVAQPGSAQPSSGPSAGRQARGIAKP